MSNTMTQSTESAKRAALAERIKELADRWAEGPATRIRFPDTRAQLHAAIDKLATLSPSPASSPSVPQVPDAVLERVGMAWFATISDGLGTQEAFKRMRALLAAAPSTKEG